MYTCISCNKQQESLKGMIVFYEMYDEFLDRDGSIRPMGSFCSMRCVSTWSAMANRLEQKAQSKKKGK